MNFGAEEVKVIGDLCRFGIPRVFGRRGARCAGSATGPSPTLRASRGGNAEAEECSWPFCTGSRLRYAKVAVDRGGRRLRRCGPRREYPTDCREDQDMRSHLVRPFLLS